MEIHPDCRSLAFLIGSWKGSGSGEYPTIEPFRYHEEVSFGHVGKPFLTYTQRTKHAETGQPLHAESGYLRALGGGSIEFVVVQPSGIVELHTGTVDEGKISLRLESVHTTPAAKQVSDVHRAVAVVGHDQDAVLTYDVAMAAVGQPLQHHLSAELRRQPMPS